MDYFLTDEQKEMKKLARQIAEEKIKPVRAKYDEQDIFPRDIVDEFVKAGMFKILVPPKYGGTSGRIVDLVIITEEFSKVCVGISLSLGATGLGLYPILISGNEEQKQKYLREIAQGKKLAAFALTEPEAGSDAASVKTTAVKNGDYYVLNGTKQWITNGSEADIYSVFALTDKSKGARGISAFIVEKGTPGFSFGKKENKLGIRGSITSELIFDDCRIPKYNLLGREGMGFMIGMKTFDKSRPMVAAQAIGVAQGALDELMKYIKKLHNSGEPLSHSQGIQFMIADMATKIESARALVYATARIMDAGAKKYSKESAMCKYYASDVAMEVTSTAVQILGGYGYTKEYAVEKMMRDAKITQIYEGTNQIQRLIVATNLIKEYSMKE